MKFWLRITSRERTTNIGPFPSRWDAVKSAQENFLLPPDRIMELYDKGRTYPDFGYVLEVTE